MRRKSLLWHIFLPFLAVGLASLVLITGYTSRTLHDFYYDRIREDLTERAQLAAVAVGPLLAANDLAGIDAFCRSQGRAATTRLTVVAADGTVFGDSQEEPGRMERHDQRPEVVAALGGRVGVAVRYSTTLGHRRIYVATPVDAGGEIKGVLRTSRSLASLDRTLAAIQQRIALGGLLLAMVVAAISYWLARRMSRPLREMKETAERLAAGRLESRLAAMPDSEEIGALAEALNTMAGQLDERIRTIENQRQEQDAVLSSMVEGVLAIDCDEIIIGVNPAACRLLDVQPAAAVGRTLQEIVRNPDLIAHARSALAGEATVDGEIELRRDGEHHLQVHATGLQAPDGRRLGALLVLNDVTRMRRLENVRRDFVANVSHELRTPITSIKGFVETLQDDPPADPLAFARFLGIIGRQADRLQAIIDDLLTLSKLEQDGPQASLAREDCRIADVLHDAVALCTARLPGDGPGVRIDCPADLRLPVNVALLEQAVVNLVDNALKHSGAAAEILVSAREEPGRVMIAVRDEGRGIAEAHLPRLFERFYRVDRARSRTLGGTGLGLAIVKHIAGAHGGEVGVTSRPGQGSTFTITLPRPAPAGGETS
ncbi:MAG TPA: ATP-binding protein [Candidatus Krumholzibacteria bacterium]|nr:ATP-binding protein [Candidatus Krumholzibacteria bacterium]HPD70482.1 ATP-binding protein [Candidatus Krumholzibacteria bacterium]HRY39818.1 ATP-binding protein [Candidatus Krumholzibacteria bacterium]